MSRRRPYVRSMDGWWRRNPYFVRYMLREGTSVLLAASAQNAAFYRLVDTNGTSNAGDDVIRVPHTVAYDADRDLAVLSFDDRIVESRILRFTASPPGRGSPCEDDCTDSDAACVSHDDNGRVGCGGVSESSRARSR